MVIVLREKTFIDLLFISGYDIIHLIGGINMAMIKNIDELEFIIFCIENVALHLKMSTSDVYTIFIKKYNKLFNRKL